MRAKRIIIGIIAIFLNILLMMHYNSQIYHNIKPPALNLDALVTYGSLYDGANVSTTMHVDEMEETENQLDMYFLREGTKLMKIIAQKDFEVELRQPISVLGSWDDAQKVVHAHEIYVHELFPIVPFYISIPALPLLLILFLRDWKFDLRKLSIERNENA